MKNTTDNLAAPILKAVRWCTLVLVVFGAACVQDLVQPPVADISSSADILSALYIPTDSMVAVRIVWGEPSGTGTKDILYYRLYRTNEINRDNVPVNFQSFGAQRQISRNVRTFDDVVGLSNARYYYQLRAAVDYSGGVVLGPASQPVSVYVGSGVGFSINGGDIYTADTLCSLMVVDPESELTSWRFTDSFTIADDGTRAPVFSAVHHRANSNQRFSAQSGKQRYAYPWVLRQGSGTKYAFVEMEFVDGRVEVREDDIAITPYRAEFKLRNETRKPIETMLVLPQTRWEIVSEAGGRQIQTYTICRPWVDFSLSIFNDTTFDDNVTFYLLFPENVQMLSAKNITFKTAEFDTVLTGIGPLHDDQHVYHYEFSPERAINNPGSMSAKNLASIEKTFPDAKPAESITGSSPNEIFDTLTRLTGAAVQVGKKEFSIVAVMRGRFFGETRIVHSSARLGGTVVTNIDVYPPLVILDRYELDFPAPGDTLKGSFSLSTNTQGSWELGISERGVVIERSGVDIVAVDLYVAEMPDTLVAKLDGTNDGEKLSHLTIDDLLGMRCRIFPYEIASPQPEVYPVAWKDIDPSSWNTGWYIFSIVTQDRYGNKGIAPLFSNLLNVPRSNPIHYYLITGRSEF